jgi:hypothetical protein
MISLRLFRPVPGYRFYFPPGILHISRSIYSITSPQAPGHFKDSAYSANAASAAAAPPIQLTSNLPAAARDWVGVAVEEEVIVAAVTLGAETARVLLSGEASASQIWADTAATSVYDY